MLEVPGNSCVGIVLTSVIFFMTYGSKQAICQAFECYSCHADFDNSSTKYTDCIEKVTSQGKATCTKANQCFETFGCHFNPPPPDKGNLSGSYVVRGCAVTSDLSPTGCTKIDQGNETTKVAGDICRCSETLCNNNTDANGYDNTGVSLTGISSPLFGLLLLLVLLPVVPRSEKALDKLFR